MGFAHGAADETREGIAPVGFAQVPAYLVIGLAGLALFIASPLVGLALFLLLSAWHFATARETGARAARGAVALLAVGGSALLRPNETAAVFAAITGGSIPSAFMLTLACAGATGAALAIIALFRRERGGATAIVALALAALAQPVLAVGAIFLLAHALPVQREQVARHGAARVRKAVRWPTAAAALATLLLIVWVLSSPASLPYAVALAFGMAIPHMLLDRVEVGPAG